MRDPDFWDRDFHRRPLQPRSFWDEHAEAMTFLAEGNRLIAHEIADAIAHLWRGMRQRFDRATRYPDQNRRLPPL